MSALCSCGHARGTHGGREQVHLDTAKANARVHNTDRHGKVASS